MNTLLYSLRQATADDAEFLYNLMKTTMRSHVEATWGEWDEEFQIAYFQKKFNPQEYRIIVIDMIDAGAIAFVESEDTIHINRLFLLPEYQGQGIGSAVESDFIHEARQKGKALTLTVIKSNQRAKQFHERLGLKVISENEERYTLGINT